MRNGVLHIVFAALLILFNGCSHETQLDSPATLCKVRLDIDWGKSGIDPDDMTGMTAIFYPIDGSERSKFLSNQITRKEISLKAGIYNVVVFNQAEGDFSYFTIEGQEQYSTLRVAMKDRKDDFTWYKPGEGECVGHEPEPFAVALTQGFEVTEAMVLASRIEGKVFSFACEPRAVTYATKLSIYIKGLYNIKEARSSIQNMAHSYSITEQKAGTDGITFCFTMADKKYDEGSTSGGVLSGTFYSFGPPEAATKATGANILNLSILLVDGKTVISKTYDVTKQIEASKPAPPGSAPSQGPDPGQKEPGIIIGGGASGDPDNPDDQPIELPDVKPENSGSQGGFDASVDEWGDETNIDIPV